MDLQSALREVTLFGNISEADRQAIAPHVELKSLKRREPAWEHGHQPDEFSFVVRGRLKLVKTNDQGRETIVDLVLPGTLLCPRAACAQLPYCCDAIAMDDDTQIANIPRARLYRLMQDRPQVIEALMRESACRNAGLCRRVEELASGQVERRIATLLLRLAEQIGDKRDEGVWIPVVLSRQDLADMCGTTVETTIRVMSRFGRQEVVKTEQGGFSVARPRVLRDIARGVAG